MALLARERARAEFDDWEKREDEFHFDQSKIRSQIRLREGRMKPIDILSKNLNVSDDFDIDIKEPYTMLKKRKREAVMVEHQRRIQEAMTAKAAVPDELQSKAMGAVEEGDTVFGYGAEVNLDPQAYWWHAKYHPRKPKYFNRVHTGYEWNKHNQTHYDHDNPPPKVVHGYKLDVFYPDLVDKSKAPTYAIEKDGNAETCILRFRAGPPYEDIAFQVVNKEWEYPHKKGFKCTFEHGTLRAHFNLKRRRYRR